MQLIAADARRKRPGRQPVRLERPRLRRQHDPLVEVSVFVVSDDRRAFRHEAAHATEVAGSAALSSAVVRGGRAQRDSTPLRLDLAPASLDQAATAATLLGRPRRYRPWRPGDASHPVLDRSKAPSCRFLELSRLMLKLRTDLVFAQPGPITDQRVHRGMSAAGGRRHGELVAAIRRFGLR